MQKGPKIDISNYKKIEFIGRGAYGYVDLVEDINTGGKFAMKYINQSQKQISSEEIDSYIKTDHPAVIKFYGYSDSNPKSLALLLEYMPNGSLKNLLKNIRNENRPKNFTGTKKYIILKGIAYGMNYLHSLSIIHQDLKTDNILLDDNFYPKICDFGISFVSDLPCSTIRMDNFIGTPLYASPEIINMESYSYKIDIYSYSMIAYELITEKTPFNGYSQNKIYENVKQGIRPDISKLPSFIQDFFNKCWSNDPMKRITFDDIINMLNTQQFLDFFNADEAEVINYNSKFNDFSTFDEFIKKIDIDNAIKEGNNYDIFTYGIIHLGIPKYYDKNKAIKYIKIAADNGYVDAILRYISILSEEKNDNQNEIIKYLKMASDKENTDAMINYSYKLLTGDGIQVNKEEGTKYLKKAADLCNKKAIFYYGLFSLEGKIIDKNLNEAAKYLKESADLLNPNAMHFYGKMLIDGEGIQVNVDEGLSYIKKAADQGNVISMFSYAYYLYHGEITPTNKKEAARYFKMAANQGDGDSAYYYARMLFYGNEVRQNKEEALKYFKIGGKNGCLFSMYLYAVIKLMKLDGSSKITKKDKKEAFHYIKKLIDLEFTQSITFFWFYTSFNEAIKSLNISNPIFDGYIPMSEKELSQYKQKALDYFERECDKGNEYILLFYVDVLSYGLSGPSDPNKVIKYLEKLVSMENVKAMNILGNKYRYGQGVDQNIFKAFSLFKNSASKGSQTGIQSMNQMLRDEEIFEKLELAGYANSADLEKLEDEEYSDFIEVCESTAEMVRKFSVMGDCNNILDYFGNGINLSYNEYEPNSNEINYLSKLKFAANKGDVNALYSYGLYILKFADSIESKAKAIEYIKEAAIKGHVDANFKYGKLVHQRIVSNESKLNASKYFKYAVDHKEMKSMFYYGKILYEERNLSEEAKNAISYIKESADFGYAKAMSFYGLLIYNGKIPGKDKNEAVKYLQESADLENPVSMLYYGNMLLEGDLVEKNTEKGIDYIKNSADSGNSDAALKYGLILYDGFEIPQNKKAAAIYLKKSADSGNEEAILKYAQMLINGDGIQENKEEGLIYMKMLADQGNKTAMFEYGILMTENDELEINLKYLEYIKDSASLGNTKALVELGKKLLKKCDNIKNVEKATELFKKAADLGDPEGMFTYENSLYFGIGIPVDKKEALNYFKRSAESKFDFGMLTYARVLSQTGDAENMKEALKYYKILLEKNDSEANLDYAIMLYNGNGVSQNKKESAKYFKKSADSGNSESMAYYGKMRFYGDGIQIDKNEAIKYLKNSIKLDNNRGMQIYGEILLSTNDLENMKEAEKLFKIVIQNGNGNGNVNKGKAELDVYGTALARYGEMLYYGIGTKNDKDEAIKLLKKSIELDNILGKIVYAEILLENDDQKSKLMAAEYFQQLIKENNSDAMYNYGMMLLTGNGISINIQEAVKYIKHAAELENLRAMLQYGNMLSEGKDVPCDKTLAAKYYKKAADRGDSTGMYKYAVDLIIGSGVPQNLDEGKKYLKKAADHGNPIAMAIYRTILSKK